MVGSTFIESYLVVFKEIVFDLESMEIKYMIKNFGLILLYSLLVLYSIFRDTCL